MTLPLATKTHSPPSTLGALHDDFHHREHTVGHLVNQAVKDVNLENSQAEEGSSTLLHSMYQKNSKTLVVLESKPQTCDSEQQNFNNEPQNKWNEDQAQITIYLGHAYFYLIIQRPSGNHRFFSLHPSSGALHHTEQKTKRVRQPKGLVRLQLRQIRRGPRRTRPKSPIKRPAKREPATSNDPQILKSFSTTAWNGVLVTG